MLDVGAWRFSSAWSFSPPAPDPRPIHDPRRQTLAHSRAAATGGGNRRAHFAVGAGDDRDHGVWRRLRGVFDLDAHLADELGASMTDVMIQKVGTAALVFMALALLSVGLILYS